MDATKLDEFVDAGWKETVRLMQDLIRAHPHYDNPVGLQEAALLIQAYLARGGVEHQLQEYRNTEFSSHPLYVDATEFGPSFRSDHTRLKRNVVSFVDGQTSGRTLILNGH